MNPLISTEELAPILGQVTLLDVRYRLGGPSGRGVYTEGHLPGAVFVDLDAALASEPGLEGRHPLPSPEVFGAAMRAAGVRSDRPVVVYDDWSGRAAARCWWLLRHFGHDDVRVLDGGLSRWVAQGGPIHEGTVLPSTGSFEPGPGRSPIVTAEGIPVLDGVLVDARDPARYRGEEEPVDPVAGHIPGAINVPTGTNLRADGRFRDPVELAALYAAAGVAEDEVTVYCGSGVTATHDILALATLGREARLYPGSWSEWVADPSRPVSTGADPGSF